MTDSADTSPVLAIDVGGTTIKGEVLTAHDESLAAQTVPTPYGDEALDAIASLGKSLVSECGDVATAGVALPGIIDRARRVGVTSANVGWRNLSFGPELEEAWGLPVYVDHDVTVAGLAEWWSGAGQGPEDVAFVALGTGIAAAFVSGGRLIRGGAGQAGEIGHVPVVGGGRRCSCGGTGCLETIASATAIARRYSELTGRDVTSARTVAASLTKDPAARQAWTEAVEALATGLAAVTYLLTPSRIVLGGGLAKAGTTLVDPVTQGLREKVYAVPVPEVAVATLGSRAGVLGAALVARRRGRV